MKTVRELQQELHQPDVDVWFAREREIAPENRPKATARRTRPVATGVWSDRVPARTRQRVQGALGGLPGPGGTGTPDYRERTDAVIRKLARAWGGQCLSAYVDKETQLERQCEEVHIWKAEWLRVKKGQWCHRCAVKARTRTIGQMQELAVSRGGRCLSTAYPGTPGKIDLECAKGHLWSASVNSVWRGCWCPVCAWESRRMARRHRRNKGAVPIVL